MIKKSEVLAFKRKKLKDYSFLKSLSLREIKDEVLAVIKGSRFLFITKPFKHQYVSFYIGACLDCFVFLLDMGLGKTKIILDIVAFRKIKRTIVLVPYDVNIEGWEEEIQIHSILKCVPMYGSSEERWKLLDKTGDVFVLNYMGLLHMCSRKNKKGKMNIHKPSVKKFSNNFNAMVLDELHFAKNNKTLTFKVLSAMSDHIGIRYGATGTPFGRSPIDLWAQFYIIDKGSALGNTIGLFTDAFFRKIIGNSGFPALEFDERYEAHLYRRLCNSSIRYADTDCQDLPEKICAVKHFGITGPAAKFYFQAVSGIIESGGSRFEIENSYAKMRQISSGFLQLKDEEENKLPPIFFPDNPKLDLLKVMCQALPVNRKLIIFLRYIPSQQLVEKTLKDLKCNYATSIGSTKNPAQEIKRFKKNKECRFLIASIDGGAAQGGNFQVANNIVFFESPESPIKRKQCIKRAWRGGQKRKVTITDLVAVAGKYSVEQKILDCLEEGENLFKSLIEGIDLEIKKK